MRDYGYHSGDAIILDDGDYAMTSSCSCEDYIIGDVENMRLFVQDLLRILNHVSRKLDLD